MARKNQKTAQPTEEKPKATETTEAPENKDQPGRNKWLAWVEKFQDIGILVGIILGLRQSPKSGEPSRPGEKQVPNWILSAFPSMTDEDEIEYNLVLSSNPNKDAIEAMEEFDENIREEGVYDEVKLRVRLVEIRREFLERLNHPAPKDESGGRLNFSVITIKDPVIEIMDRILEEETYSTKTFKELFERQKRIAINRKLLEKKHFLKKCFEWSRENKGKSVAIVFMTPLVILTITLSILNLIFG